MTLTKTGKMFPKRICASRTFAQCTRTLRGVLSVAHVNHCLADQGDVSVGKSTSHTSPDDFSSVPKQPRVTIPGAGHSVGHVSQRQETQVGSPARHTGVGTVAGITETLPLRVSSEN